MHMGKELMRIMLCEKITHKIIIRWRYAISKIEMMIQNVSNNVC